MNTENAFSIRIKELRESSGLSQTEFAKSVGTTQTTLSAYETLDRTPSLDIVKEIAKRYNVSIDWLLGLSETKTLAPQFKTYADILHALFLIGDACQLSFHTHSEEIFEPGVSGYPELSEMQVYSIGFTLYDLNNYIMEWNKMYSLYQDGTIDREVYALWIEKTLKKATAQKLYKPTSFSDLVEIEDVPF